MNHAKHSSQGGFFLIALTAVLATIAFIFILGYSSAYSKRQSQSLHQNQTAYLLDVKTRLENAYATDRLNIDADLTYAAYRTPAPWYEMAGINPSAATNRWSLEIAVSDRISRDGIMYTVVALWLPTDTDATNPPIFNTADGTFQSCTTAPCPERAYTTLSGYGLQVAAQNDTKKTLNDVAFKAQSYFRARMLTDPTRNISINYFMPPFVACSGTTDDIPCIPNYTAIDATPLPALIGLDSDERKNAWGLDIEATNITDSNIISPPYTMSFRTQSPWAGTSYQIFAVQPL